jgi:hypothetical protein
MKIKLIALACAASLAAVSGVAMAQTKPYAKVETLNGTVTVSANSQSVPATSGMALTEGSQVMVGGAGTAKITFSNGCTVTLNANDSLRVTESECSALVARRAAVPGAAGSNSTAVAVFNTAVAAVVVLDMTSKNNPPISGN